jgi:hypothetical protein
MLSAKENSVGPVKCLFNDAVRIQKKNDLCVFRALMEGLFTKVIVDYDEMFRMYCRYLMG